VKILAIMGSPRKGESYAATKLVEQKMKDLGNVEFKYLFLKDVQLENCLGCHNCILVGEEKCPHKDARDIIREKIVDADGVIFVTPVHSQNVSVLMKNFLDHFAYLWHRPCFFHKKALVIASGGGQFKETLSALKQSSKAWGFDFVQKLGVPHLDSLTPGFRQKVDKKIEGAARAFHEAVLAQQVSRPKLGDLIWFRMWRMTAIACKDSNPTDFRHWTGKGWISSQYYYETKINPFSNMVSSFIGQLTKIFMRKVYKGY
jgi:multimeric flavodoxin WrbA